ncbi:hypothetical protein H0H87_007977 [Tephrocybe sp. NHM501043]|nr:hypothetical protein H0H87_007977 [Tephrocybe sp. NHM501043]
MSDDICMAAESVAADWATDDRRIGLDLAKQRVTMKQFDPRARRERRGDIERLAHGSGDDLLGVGNSYGAARLDEGRGEGRLTLRAAFGLRGGGEQGGSRRAPEDS